MLSKDVMQLIGDYLEVEDFFKLCKITKLSIDNYCKNNFSEYWRLARNRYILDYIIYEDDVDLLDMYCSTFDVCDYDDIFRYRNYGTKPKTIQYLLNKNYVFEQDTLDRYIFSSGFIELIAPYQKSAVTIGKFFTQSGRTLPHLNYKCILANCMPDPDGKLINWCTMPTIILNFARATCQHLVSANISGYTILSIYSMFALPFYEHLYDKMMNKTIM